VEQRLLFFWNTGKTQTWDQPHASIDVEKCTCVKVKILLVLSELMNNHTIHLRSMAIVLALLAPFSMMGADLFSDDFSGGLESHWAEVNDDGSALELSARAERSSVLVAGDAAWADYVVSAKMRVPEANDTTGLVFGYRNPQNYYRFSIDSEQGKRSLVKAVNGVQVVLAEDSFAFNDEVRYAVEARMARGNVGITMDGSPVFQVADVSHNSGKIGLYSTAALNNWSNVWSRFDAIQVKTEGSDPAQPEASATEMLAFDWNKIITKKKGRYFEGQNQWNPDNHPVRGNTDWTLPPNFAKGTYYVRVMIRKLNVKDAFQIEFNHWQTINGKLAEAVLKSPKDLKFSYQGAPIVRTFTFPVANLRDMHKVSPSKYSPFDWRRPREYIGFYFPEFAATPPDHKLANSAYPVDLRFTIVVVAPGAKFSGWNNY
jgi:hypothetical protein